MNAHLCRAIAIILGLAPLLACAQAWPSKPIRVVVPYPPGGVDVTVRLLAPFMEKELGQPLVVDYRPGAGGLIGHEHVAHSAPDGYTLLATVANPWINQPALRKVTPYDPIRDFTPITIALDGGNLVVAHPAFPANNMRELLDYAKRNPGKVSFATSGIGSAQHLDGESIARLGAVEFIHVPFQGFGQMIPAMISGQVPVGFITLQISGSLIKGGKLKILGSTDNARSSLIPAGVQMVNEVLPGFVGMPGWLGYGAPAALPRAITLRVYQSIVRALKTPELAQRFANDGIGVVGNTPEEFAARLKTEYEMVKQAIKAAGIPPQE
jgi:tripartite-type tricarboxylate transporter receptor subunit TctC